jgi:hypothetical protein
MTSKPAFVARFLVLFALLSVAGWLTGAPRHYSRLLQESAAAISPAVSGWWLEQRPAPNGRSELWFRRGDKELKMALSLPALALGLLPLLSLLGATPGLGWRRLGRAALIGCAAIFALDLLVLLLYPALVAESALADIAGTFLGLLTFVGGPVILWFILTFDRLRGVWRLGSAEKSDV